MLKSRASTALLLSALLGACASGGVRLDYAPSPGALQFSERSVPLSIGRIDDARDLPPTLIGSIEATDTHPALALEAQAPVAEIVRAAVLSGLRARGGRDAPDDARYRISGSVRRLAATAIHRHQASAEIEIVVHDLVSGGERFRQRYEISRVGAPAGEERIPDPQAEAEALRALTEATMRAVIDRALDDAALRYAIGQR
ncbi:MAG: hypothetical protein R3E48_07110 [Burkholderiaceae bacterium]